jgi:glutamate racemase
MIDPRILIFDSGMGGLTVSNAIARQMPKAALIYAADTAAFPYGAWPAEKLGFRIIRVLTELIALVKPDVVVIACNTASTLAMIPVRRAFPLPFVGTVPAIKPAAEQSRSRIFGVLATPGTVSREYTHNLIKTYAGDCQVILHGAPRLAEIAERRLRGEPVSATELITEITPVFREISGRKTDVVVLGCTHYPLLVSDMRKVAPWEVSYLDPAPAIARRVQFVADELANSASQPSEIKPGTVFLTSATATAGVRKAYASMGFPDVQIIDIPV